MRVPLLPLVLLTRLVSAQSLADALLLLPFIEPFADQKPSSPNNTVPDSTQPIEQELRKRQNSCRTGYANCATLGQPGLCCSTNAVCAADGNGNVACCPMQASCTGTIRPVTTGTGTTTAPLITSTITPSTLSGSMTVVAGAGITIGGAATATTSGNIVFVGATGTSQNSGGLSARNGVGAFASFAVLSVLAALEI